MAKISKFLQLTEYICLEYITDVNNNDNKNIETRNGYIVTDLIGNKQYVEVTDSNNNLLNTNYNLFHYNGIEGWFVPNKETLAKLKSQRIISDYIKLNDYGEGTPFDTIRLHFVTSFIPEEAGLLLNVNAFSDKTEIRFVSLVLNKLAFYDNVKFNSNPMYMNSRTYDRYIEFEIPSLYNIGLIRAGSSFDENSESKSIYTEIKAKLLSDIKFEFLSLIDGDTYHQQFDSNNTPLNLVDVKPVKLLTTTIPMLSNADNFNIIMREHKDKGYIEYYATWGDPYTQIEAKPLGLETMNKLETGEIPLNFGPKGNKNSGLHDFIETYGSDARKWVVIHELTATEHYGKFGDTDDIGNLYQFTQKNFFTETYETDPALLSPDSFKYKYRPIVGEKMDSEDLKALTLIYTCRLMNRMDGTQIIRTASLGIPNPKPYYGANTHRIDVSGLAKFKVFNKKVVNTIDHKEETIGDKPTYVREFYDTNEIQVMVNDDGDIFKSTTTNLNFNRYDHNYKLRFETKDIKTGNVKPLDLSGPFKYFMVSRDINNNEIQISPTYSANMNLVLGELEFKISEEIASRLFKVPANQRVYGIICINADGSKSAFAEGYII